MTLGIVRLGDVAIGTCKCHKNTRKVKGKVITASTDTYANSLGIARLGDMVKFNCGHVAPIVSASNETFTNSLGTARLGDKVMNKCIKAVLVTASEDTFTN
jgi:uncharacterized Zn-binding protein involved in type VI secretion